jgi:UBA/TS-N domain
VKESTAASESLVPKLLEGEPEIGKRKLSADNTVARLKEEIIAPSVYSQQLLELVDMGFSADHAHSALEFVNGDVQQA